MPVRAAQIALEQRDLPEPGQRLGPTTARARFAEDAERLAVPPARLAQGPSVKIELSSIDEEAGRIEPAHDLRMFVDEPLTLVIACHRVHVVEALGREDAEIEQ